MGCDHVSVKEAVLPFDRFEGSDAVLGPEMRSTGDVDIVVNTPTGSGARTDGWEIRRAAVMRGIPCLTTLSAGVSAARAIARARERGEAPVLSLQELHRATAPDEASVS